jgi:hypothetical protein
MSNELAVQDVKEMANAALNSGFFPQIKTREAAFTLLMLAQSEGLHPLQALRRFDIIEGKPALKSDAMMGDFQARGGRIEWHEHSHTVVSATFSAPGLIKPVTVTWTIQDAQRAGLATRKNWQAYPRQMMRARVVSEGIRMAMPAVVSGIYTPEETQDIEYKEKPATLTQVLEKLDAKPTPHDPVTGEVLTLAPEEHAKEPESAEDIEALEAGDSTDLVECFRWEKTTKEWISRGPLEKLRRKQQAKIHALRTELGITDEEWRTKLVGYFNKDTSSNLSVDEASTVIDKLEVRKVRFGTKADKDAKQHRRAAAVLSELNEFAMEERVPGQEG